MQLSFKHCHLIIAIQLPPYMVYYDIYPEINSAVYFVIVAYMLSRKEPCPKCGIGVYQLGSRNYYSHLKYYKEIENINNNDDNAGDDESLVSPIHTPVSTGVF